MFNSLKSFVLYFFFPHLCIGCGKEKELLCQKCLKEINRPSLPKNKNVFTVADYNDPIVKKAIWLLKYNKVKSIAERLAELAFQRIDILKETNKRDFIMIPIPLSCKRLRQRGFNQSYLLAKFLSDRLNQANSEMSFTVIDNVLYKKIHTANQVSIKNKKERFKNVIGTFAVKNPEMIFKENIILIDDVSTTGATLKEASKTLRASGSGKIFAIVLARG